MGTQDYKTSIKTIIDATEDETLLKIWKEQLEWDVAHGAEAELSPEEWQAVQEGLADYQAGNVLSLKQFTDKR